MSDAIDELLDVVEDILEHQIGTRMFWGTEEKFQNDGFALYVDAVLRDVYEKVIEERER